MTFEMLESKNSGTIIKVIESVVREVTLLII